MKERFLLGNCKDKLKELDDNSIDAIVTDPPYELGFMGKGWDSTGIANDPEMWVECLRVLKPGGHLLAFSGTRTYHRMASAIEDAGFEIRDMIEWVYGSGFPKSHNIGKSVDKLQGNEREVVGNNGTRPIQTSGRINAEASANGKFEREENIVTKGTSEWEGWGTALKPAHEPICMARKPLAEKTVAENVLKYGTGGINIDESRVATQEKLGRPYGGDNEIYGEYKMERGTRTGDELTGRFPANLCHDNSEEVRECFPDGNPPKNTKPTNIKAFDSGTSYKIGRHEHIQNFYPDNSGSTARFFKSIIYKSKASKKERNIGCEGLPLKSGGSNAKGYTEDVAKGLDRNRPVANFHPTVKPIALMEYLINMVSREGQVILDPFMGSGTTGMACKKLGRDFVGMEMMEEYMEIAKARIDGV